jgi:uracil-DNA glycosylase
MATQAEIDWAHRYRGYERLASSPHALGDLIERARQSYRASGQVPDWCGVDFLRGWAYYIVREDRHSGGGNLDGEWTAVLNAVRAHPHALGVDRPPARPEDNVVLPTHFSNKPKMHKDSGFLAVKQSRLWEPHVAPVNQFVDRIRTELGQQWSDDPAKAELPVYVPYVDPDSGGARARVLLVLESPAGPAAVGSGMLSADNNDETAKNLWRAYEASGMPRTYGLHWNAVPWYVGDGKRNAAVRRGDVETARDYLMQLLDLAPEIEVVIAMGKPAQASLAVAAPALAQRGIHLINTWHPSPIPAASTKGQSLLAVNAAFAEALAIVTGDHHAAGTSPRSEDNK